MLGLMSISDIDVSMGDAIETRSSSCSASTGGHAGMETWKYDIHARIHVSPSVHPGITHARHNIMFHPSACMHVIPILTIFLILTYGM